MIRLDGSAALRRRLNAIARTQPMLATIQREAVFEAKELVPRKTARLARSIVPGALTGSHAFVHARTGYAAYVEHGTSAHDIKPKRAKVLAWPAAGTKTRLSGKPRLSNFNRATGKPKAGTYAYARRVRHPGTRAQPYLVPGAKAALRTFGIESIIKPWNDAA